MPEEAAHKLLLPPCTASALATCTIDAPAFTTNKAKFINYEFERCSFKKAEIDDPRRKLASGRIWVTASWRYLEQSAKSSDRHIEWMKTNLEVYKAATSLGESDFCQNQNRHRARRSKRHCRPGHHCLPLPEMRKQSNLVSDLEL